MSKIRDELQELTILQAVVTAKWERGQDCSFMRSERSKQLDKIVKQVDALVEAAQEHLDLTVDPGGVSTTEDNLYAALNDFY